jgi:hypothetical protein
MGLFLCERRIYMAITEKIKSWFEKEYSNSLKEAFEIQQYELREQGISRDLDAENAKLADYIARPVYVPKR